MLNTQMSPSPGSSPRLPSPPPFTEVQIGPKSPSFGDPSAAIKRLSNQENGDADASRRIRPGTKAKNMSAGPPLTPLGELDSAFQLQEHLMAMYQMHTHPPDSETTVAITPSTAYLLASAPQGVETWLWLYELTRLLTVKINVIIVAFFNDSPPCSAVTCPEMRASEWQYLCAVHDPPKSCCAIDYCCHTLDHAASILTSSKYFPSRLSIGGDNGAVSGKSQGERHISSIFRRLYRIFAHAWFQHRSIFWDVEGEHGLYIFFKTVSDHYNLIPPDNYTIPAEAFGSYLPGSSMGDSKLDSAGQQQTRQLPFRMLSKDSKERENKLGESENTQNRPTEKSITATTGDDSAGTEASGEEDVEGGISSKTTRRTKHHIMTDIPLAGDDIMSARYMPTRDMLGKKDLDLRESSPIALVPGKSAAPAPSVSRPPAEKTTMAPPPPKAKSVPISGQEKTATESTPAQKSETRSTSKEGSPQPKEASDGVKAAKEELSEAMVEAKDFTDAGPKKKDSEVETSAKPASSIAEAVSPVKEKASTSSAAPAPASASAITASTKSETVPSETGGKKVDVVDLTKDENPPSKAQPEAPLTSEKEETAKSTAKAGEDKEEISKPSATETKQESVSETLLSKSAATVAPPATTTTTGQSKSTGSKDTALEKEKEKAKE